MRLCFRLRDCREDRPRSPGGGDAQLARSVSYTHYHSEVLAGEELEDYRTRMAEEEQRRKEEAAAAAAAAVAAAQEAAARDDALLGGSDDDDDFEDEEFGTTGGFVGAAGGRSLGGTGAGGRRGNGQVQRQQFDFKPVMRRMGEYGQPIKLGDFGLTTVYDPTNPEFTMRERMEDELNRGADVEEEYDTDDDEVRQCAFCYTTFYVHMSILKFGLKSGAEPRFCFCHLAGGSADGRRNPAKERQVATEKSGCRERL